MSASERVVMYTGRSVNDGLSAKRPTAPRLI